MNEKLDLQVKSLASIKDFFLNFLIPLICIGISALLLVFIAYPSFKSLSPLQKEISEKQALKNQLQTKLSKLNSLVDYQSVVDENSSLIQQALVDEPMVPQLLTQVHSIATESGLVVDKLNYSFTDPTKTSSRASATQQEVVTETLGYKEVNISLGASGNYDQLVTFLDNLEKASRLVISKSFRFSSMDKENEGKYTINFSLSSPYLKVESNAVTDDPISLNMGDEKFISLVNWVKGLRHYDISLEDVNVVLVQESEEEGVDEALETAETAENETSVENVILPGGDTPITESASEEESEVVTESPFAED